MRNRRASQAAGTVEFGGLHQHHHGVFGIFKRRKRREPEIVGGEPARAVFHLRGPGLGANFQSGHGGVGAGAFAALHVREHRVAQNLQAACMHHQPVAHHAGRKICRHFARRGVLRLDALDEARPQNCSAVGDRRNHHGHLNRRDVNRTLANAQIRRVALAPAGMDLLFRGKISARFLIGEKSSAFPEVELLPDADDVFDAGARQAGVDEIRIA